MGSLLGMVLPKAQQSGSAPVPMGGGTISMPGMSSSANPDLQLIRTYKQNGTVRSNSGLIAESVAGQQWVMFRKGAPAQRFTTSDQGSDQRKQVMVHAALNCLENPASVTVNGIRRPVIDRFMLFELSDIWMTQTGKAHWVVDFAEGASKIPLGLWPVRPDRMTPVPDRRNFLAGWVYTSPDGREQVPLLPTEVIFNRFADPEDMYGGCGPIQSVLTDIEAADYASQWNRNYFVNSAEPGGVLQLDHELGEGEFDELVSRWRETHRGVARAHRIAVLEAGVTWVPNQHGSVKDMDFANLRSVMRDIIREALGMAKVMTGVSDDVNRANAQTGQEVFASWKVEPRLQRWRNVLNTQFLPLFGATAEGVEFDYVYPRPENREQDALELTTKANAALALVTAGYDAHDVLATIGLPDMKVALRVSTDPALPPRWTPGNPAAPGAPNSAPAVPAGPEAALRAAIGWDSPLWAAVEAQMRSRTREMAAYNQLTTGAR
jgi:portal protein